MQAEWPLLPEFDLLRHNTEARPIRRSRHRADGELRGVERDCLLEGESAFERRGLLAGPGADLRHARARGVIGIGLRIRDVLDDAAQPDLALQQFPVEGQRRLRGCCKLETLDAVAVGVEHEAALVETLQQHHPRIGHAIGIDGGERHGFGIDRLGALGLRKPGGKQTQGLGGIGKVTAR